MSILESLSLGALQGITEFLPISSSGHLLMLQKFLSFQKEDILVDVVVHGGTFLSILTFYYEDIRRSFKNFKFWGFVLLANLMTALLVFPFKEFFESFFYEKSLLPLAFCFFLTALVLLTSLKSPFKTKKLGLLQALGVGLIQGVCVLPGLSRSGLTICTGLLLGLSRKEASFFSFTVALPALLGAVFFKTAEIEIESFLFVPLFVAFLSSYIIGLIALKFLVKFIEKGKLHIFSVYLFVLGSFLVIKEVMGMWL